ncbi:MAG: PH domain-containing protein [Bacteroidota bacterium]
MTRQDAPTQAHTPPAAESAGPQGITQDLREAGQRLHPLTLVQRLILSLPGLVFLLLPVWRSPGGEAWFSLVVALVYAVIAVPLIVVQYVRFRYRVTPKELVIRRGVFTVQQRSIPVERIQNIQIERGVLPRLLGTAKVRVETAGSSGAEGVLEYVSLEEAQALRQVIRAYQREQKEDVLPAPPAHSERPAAEVHTAPATDTLFQMPLGRVLLSGAFRFSLFYIAVIFSGLQYLNLDPEEIADWVMRERYGAYTSAVEEVPGWLLAAVGILVAALLGWATGILINLSRYYGFRLWLEEGKLQRRHGLLTVSEGTIPLPKVQALILRTNPLMRRFGWYGLEVQTMGLDVDQAGHQVAVPFGRLGEVERVADTIRPVQLPQAFQRVSPLMVRRLALRYTTGLLALVAVGVYFFEQTALWGLLAWPLLVAYAYLEYRNHGYVLQEDTFYVRRGVLRQHTWVIPAARFQVFYASATLFQRRLDLASLYVDTAGASSMAFPRLQDLPAAEASALLEEVYVRFQETLGPAQPHQDPRHPLPLPVRPEEAAQAPSAEPLSEPPSG